MSTPEFPCERCEGTGQRFGGKCRSCRGKGGFTKSPDSRAKNRARRRNRLILQARQENQSNPALYCEIIVNSPYSAYLAQLRSDDRYGKVWTAGQRRAAQIIINGLKPMPGHEPQPRNRNLT